MSQHEPVITVRPEGNEGWYDVYADGVKTAQVRKRVEHYNLRRPITTVSWFLWGLDHQKIDDYPYATRKAALAALRTRLDQSTTIRPDAQEG